MNTVSSVNLHPNQGNRGDKFGLRKFCVKIFYLTREGTEGNKMEHYLWCQSSSISSRSVNRGEGNRA
ncbi:hypothetical protein NC652_034755 [Populus alba x Populus x berolinensis]|uniref:Uncharacterized protein n=1 Tax=Populus alba x Populus x berolinensis TaxID=444605 RepID=A0AAD6LLR8_9ROSI|nr:hypothetical protein NC652_034755 [Populus alba x Populus x berolinensis]KAJ6969462.1 hypothetical protein NC653_034097 [Populus alba x Populus x berolinensis]